MVGANRTRFAWKSMLAFAVVLILLAFGNVADASPRTYKNCAQLNAVFKSGVSLNKKPINRGAAILAPSHNAAVYNANKKLDVDRDGIACEVIRRISVPSASTSPNSDTALALSKPLDTCRLQETSNQSGAGAKGFPARRTVRASGEVKVAILPVDFANAVGIGNPEVLYRDDVQKIQEWGRFFSRGKMNYKVEFKATQWLRAPRGAEWYTCLACQKGAKEQKQPQQDAIQELVNVADSIYDFSSTDLLYFVFPFEAEKQFGTALYSHNVTLQTREGPMSVAVYGEMGGGVGAVADRTKIWDHAIHEFLHFQGFIGHGPDNGTDYYISTNQWGASKAVTSWEAFLNGWFDATEILCLDKADIIQPISLTLDSIDVFGSRVESVMIRLNQEQLLIVELRANGPFTNFCSTCASQTLSGLTAYRVNVNGVHYRNDADPDSAAKNFWGYVKDGSSNVINSSIEFGAIRITRTAENQISIAPAR